MSPDKQENRISKILNNLDLDVNEENLKTYRKYLIENLKSPTIITGIEDFSWEERYVFGHGSQKEYEKLKK